MWSRLLASYSTQCTQLANRLSNITTVTTGQITICSENAIWPLEDGRKDARNILRNNLLTIKSLIVASTWSHIYLLIKDARSLEHKAIVGVRCSQMQTFWDYWPSQSLLAMSGGKIRCSRLTFFWRSLSTAWLVSSMELFSLSILRRNPSWKRNKMSHHGEIDRAFISIRKCLEQLFFFQIFW